LLFGNPPKKKTPLTFCPENSVFAILPQLFVGDGVGAASHLFVAGLQKVQLF